MILLKWNKESRKKFAELSKDTESITIDRTPLGYKNDKGDRDICYKMFIGGELVFATPKFIDKLIEYGVIIE